MQEAVAAQDVRAEVEFTVRTVCPAVFFESDRSVSSFLLSGTQRSDIKRRKTTCRRKL